MVLLNFLRSVIVIDCKPVPKVEFKFKSKFGNRTAIAQFNY